MNKKLFIFTFLLIASPVFANDTPYVDNVVEESAPVIEQVQPVQENKVSFKSRVKDFFTREDKTKAQDIQAVEPSEEAIKTMESVEKAQKERNKELKKQQRANEKALKKQQKEAKKAYEKAEKEKAQHLKEAHEAALETAEASMENQQDIAKAQRKAEKENKKNPNLQASVDTNRIMEVDECVKIALEKHPMIRMAMSNAEIYHSRIAQAWANYFPTVTAGINYSKNDMQVANFAFPIQEYEMFLAPTISGNLLLFDFGKTKAQADIAKRSFESAEFALQNSINNIIFSVKQAYFSVLFAQQQVKVYEETVKDFTLHLEQAKAYYEIGSKPKIEVLTAEHNLGKAKLNLLNANNTLKIAYVQLSNAMGTPEASEYDVVDNLKTNEYDIDIENAVQTAYETSPELLSAKKRADASKLLVRASRRAFTPDLQGFGGYTRGGKKLDTDHGYQVGAQLAYTNLNLMKVKKQVDEAKATHNKDLAAYENTKQTIYFQVKQAYLNLTNAQESIVVAKLSMDQAQEQYDQASGRYKVGLGDAIELKDAETTYRNAQLDYYNSLLTYHVSAANLEKLMGAPIQTSENELL